MLLILKVETESSQGIVHVTVVGEGVDAPCHMPFSADAIGRSIVGLVESTYPLPDLEGGIGFGGSLSRLGKPVFMT